MVSPASYPTVEQLDDLVETLRSWELVPVLGEHVLDQHGYMAGSDTARLADLNAALSNPEIRAVIATRGGAGAYRIADRLAFDALVNDPKPIVGYSDITYLHLSAWSRARATSIHGCLADAMSKTTARQILMSTTAVELRRDPQAVSASIERAGAATGVLIGGNLASVATSVGVRLPNLADRILFIESQRAVGLGTVDRQLTQLLMSGALDGLAAIALGSFEGFRGYSDRGWTLSDVLADRLLPLGIPILGGLPAGHDLAEQASLPLGTQAHLDTVGGTIVVDAPAIA